MALIGGKMEDLVAHSWHLLATDGCCDATQRDWGTRVLTGVSVVLPSTLVSN